MNKMRPGKLVQCSSNAAARHRGNDSRMESNRVDDLSASLGIRFLQSRYVIPRLMKRLDVCGFKREIGIKLRPASYRR